MTTPAGAPTRESTMTLSGNRELRIERVFDARPDRIFRAMTELDLVRQWWGRGNKLDIECLEPVRGGHWRFVEHHEGGSDGFEGRFREVTPERLSQTFEWDGMPGYPSIQTSELQDLGDGRTRVVTTVQFFTPEERDQMVQYGMKAGLDQSYAALDGVLASLG